LGARFKIPGHRIHIDEVLKYYFGILPDSTYSPLGAKYAIIQPKSIKDKALFMDIFKAKVQRYIIDELLSSKFLGLDTHYMYEDAMTPFFMAMGKGEESADDFGMLTQTQLLVINLAAVMSNRYMPEVLYRLFSLRYDKSLATWFLLNETGNKAVDERVHGYDNAGNDVWLKVVTECTKITLSDVKGA